RETQESLAGVQEELNSLKDNVTGRIEDGLTGLKLQVKAAMLPKELDGFLGELNPLVEAFTSVKSLLDGNAPEEGKQTIQSMIAEKFAGADMRKLMESSTAPVVLQHIEMKNPGFLFRLCMDSTGIKDITNIPVGSTIAVLYSGFSKEVVDFMDRSLFLSQVLPDPTITGIRVKKRTGGDEEEYTRTFGDGAIKFVSSTGESIDMKDIASLTITKKDGDPDRRRLWSILRTRVDASTHVDEVMNDEAPSVEYTGDHKAKTEKVTSTYASLPYSEKLSPGGNINAGCFMTAFNLARRTWGFNLRDNNAAKPIESNSSLDESKNCLTYIPHLIAEKKLPPGTIFWIQKNPTIHDPSSVSSAAGNHWFTFVGYRKEPSGREVPYFVDQFGYGNIERMKGGYPKRYFHQAFVPPAART
ncbi:hypothetical protein COW46_01670, partial [Candidatus Gracilibacteria bacterium CG17_big_fil_post_rev_8_21_14_2_50_48_13]